MLIKHIIEFEWREPGPTGRTCTLITAYLHDKTKIFKENVGVNYYLLLKYCKRQGALLGPNHLPNLAPKCNILNVFWTNFN